MKEKVLIVKFNTDPDYKDRKTFLGDEKLITNIRGFSFIIPDGYSCNGADIPFRENYKNLREKTMKKTKKK